MRYLLTGLILLSATAFAADSQDALYLKLHQASEHIGSHADRQSITESLYRQMRPLALITDHSLTPEQVDQRVRRYIANKYTPVLISNYSQLYAKMRTAKQDFSGCENPNEFALNGDISMALCVDSQSGGVKIKYLTKGYGSDWKQTSAFVFKVAQQARLIAIELGLHKDQRVHIEGI